MCKGRIYLFCGLKSLISTLRKGRKAVPQKGQVLLRFESFAVQPAMISSSYTRQSHVLQSEQLDIKTYNKNHHKQEEIRHSATLNRVSLNHQGSVSDNRFHIKVAYLYGVTGSGLKAAGVRGGIWRVRSIGWTCQTTWI